MHAKHDGATVISSWAIPHWLSVSFGVSILEIRVFFCARLFVRLSDEITFPSGVIPFFFCKMGTKSRDTHVLGGCFESDSCEEEELEADTIPKSIFPRCLMFWGQFLRASPHKSCLTICMPVNSCSVTCRRLFRLRQTMCFFLFILKTALVPVPHTKPLYRVPPPFQNAKGGQRRNINISHFIISSISSRHASKRP